MHHNNIDLIWTSTLIHELMAHGVSYFCLSPGSRSTPLVLGLSAHPDAKTFVHFDERAMAFHALGFAKASKKPVAIITTSATATGNLLPAIMEAHESAIPLLILTADRPFELQECGANQTTHQTHMFQNYVRWQCTLPVPSPAISIEYLKTTLAHAVGKASLGHPGPVHLNCPFREPFSFALNSLDPFTHTHPKTELISSQPLLDDFSLSKLATLINHSHKGVILLGYEALEKKDLSRFYAFAETLQWPIFSDVLSQGRDHPLSISYYDLAWDIMRSYPDCVLHFGGPFVSKHLMAFLKEAAPQTYIHCIPYVKRQDPMHLVTHKVIASAGALCTQLLPHMISKTSSYFLEWSTLDLFIQHSIQEFFTHPQPWNEPLLSHTLSHYDLSQYALFLASSMPIRNTTQFFHPVSHPPQYIYGNRGLSGIDGNIATTIGIAKALNLPMIALLGDQTFLHDLTSLSQLHQLTHPILFLIINNGGGTIFSFLPVYKHEELCKRYFVNPHHFTFAPVAELFQLDYHHCSSLTEFHKAFTLALSGSCHALIEIKTDLETNLNTHRMIKQKVLNHAECSLLRK